MQCVMPVVTTQIANSNAIMIGLPYFNLLGTSAAVTQVEVDTVQVQAAVVVVRHAVSGLDACGSCRN